MKSVAKTNDLLTEKEIALEFNNYQKLLEDPRTLL